MHLRFSGHALSTVPFAKLALLACVMGLGCGCEVKSFIDPDEVGRYKKGPLMVPIAAVLDPAVEEMDDRWSRATPPTSEDIRTPPMDYRIAPDDLVAIEIGDLRGPGSDTVKQARVTETGLVSVPELDHPIRAAGMTEMQLEDAIVQAYRDARLTAHATVSVTMLESRSRTFSIFGAIGGPNEYAILKPNFRLLDALILSHGVNSPFVDTIYILRPIVPPPADHPPGSPGRAPAGSSPPATGPASEDLAPRSDAEPSSSPAAVSSSTETSQRPVYMADKPASTFDSFRDPGPEQQTRVIRISYESLRRGDLRNNIPILPNDEIYVVEPQSGFYYCGGHVARPGAFTLSGQPMTLKDVIISAGMFDGLAIPQRTDVIRRISLYREVYVRVDLDKIFSGEAPDIYVKPGDKIMVGTNILAPFIAAARGGFRVTYGLGFLYDRNYSYNNVTTTTGK